MIENLAHKSSHEAYHKVKKWDDYDNKMHNLLIPSGMSDKELDEYCKAKSGEVITYNLNN